MLSKTQFKNKLDSLEKQKTKQNKMGLVNNATSGVGQKTLNRKGLSVLNSIKFETGSSISLSAKSRLGKMRMRELAPVSVRVKTHCNFIRGV